MRATNEQLELTLADNGMIDSAPEKKVERKSRAEWWFRQMRQVVDKAMDWEPAPRFRPQQMWIAGTNRRF